MLTAPFYHKTVRSYIANFADLFNNIQIRKYDKTGEITKTIRVPIALAAREKWYVREKEEYNADPNKTGIKASFPRISYMLEGISYDSQRKRNTTNRVLATAEGGQTGYQMSPAPYSLEMSVGVAAYTMDEMLQIVEQIIPYFQPDFNMRVRDNPAVPTDYTDVPVSLNSVSPTIEADGTLETRRIISCELSFTIKGYIHSPVIYNDDGNTGRINRALVNMYPTTDPEFIASDDKIPAPLYETKVNPLEALESEPHTFDDEWFEFGDELPED